VTTRETALQAAKRACNELAAAHDYFNANDTLAGQAFYEVAAEDAENKARAAMEVIWTERPVSGAEDERLWERHEKVAQAAWLMLLACLGEDAQPDFARSAAELFGRASEL
jgi:hypothetical protein